jgi:SPP1 gp7 family putative phage head morphogenesis protein
MAERPEAGPADSIDGLSDRLAADWRAAMAPIAVQLVAFVQDRPDLQAAADELAGLLPRLNDQSLGSAMFQGRLAGLLGVPVSPGETADPGTGPGLSFAEAVELTPLADSEAVRFLQSKTIGQRFSFDWRDVREQEHVAAFVVAKAMQKDLLADIHGELVTALKDGMTRDEFVRKMTPILQAHGWWGVQERLDDETKQVREVQLGSARRLKTIYDVNIRMAHAAGRWERLTKTMQPGDLLRYTAVIDSRTRAQHRAWHGVTLPIDHAFWDAHYPPNGWNCRCTTTTVLSQVARRRGIQPTSEEELRAQGAYDQGDWFNERKGVTERIPKGVTPGFAYNVGKARMASYIPEPPPGPPPEIGAPGRTSLIEQLKDKLPEPLDARRLIAPPWSPPADDAAAAKAFLDIIRPHAQPLATGELVFTDAAQVPITVSERLFQDRATGGWKLSDRDRTEFLPLLAQTLLSPDEIWAAFEEIRDAEGRLVKRVWKRRYLARWALAGHEQPGLVIFEEDGGAWHGVTAFPPAQSSSDARKLRKLLSEGRTGVLMWRRAE